MKEEDFIFNDEPLCNEDDLIDYNRRQNYIIWRKIMGKKANRLRRKGRIYSVHEPPYHHPSVLADCACTLRDLEEQGVKALTKLLDADPPTQLEEQTGRKCENNTTNYNCIKWENAEIREKADRQKMAEYLHKQKRK